MQSRGGVVLGRITGDSLLKTHIPFSLPKKVYKGLGNDTLIVTMCNSSDSNFELCISTGWNDILLWSKFHNIMHIYSHQYLFAEFHTHATQADSLRKHTTLWS